VVCGRGFVGAVFLSKFLFVGVGFSSGFFGTVYWFFLCGGGVRTTYRTRDIGTLPHRHNVPLGFHKEYALCRSTSPARLDPQ
jgi:hypothetical protein